MALTGFELFGRRGRDKSRSATALWMRLVRKGIHCKGEGEGGLRSRLPRRRKVTEQFIFHSIEKGEKGVKKKNISHHRDEKGRY